MAQSDVDTLEMVDRHIAASERHISEQRHRIWLTERAGKGKADLSRSILKNFEECLRLHHEHRAMILHKLATT